MRPTRTFLMLLSFTIAAPVLRADVTVRYKTEVHAQQLPGAASPNAIPPATILQIKGNKAFTNFGLGSSLLDSDKQEVTVLDATHKLFATVLMKDYAGELPSLMPSMPNLPPAAQQILDSMKTDVGSRKTGRTDTILGIQVEETEWTISLAIPLPPGVPAPSGIDPSQPVTIMKMVLQSWSATPEEQERQPAIKEWIAYSSNSARLLNPFGALQQFVAGVPGIGKGLAPAFQQLEDQKRALLKSHMELYIPAMTQIAPMMRAQGQLPAGFDPNAALIQADTVATEISVAPIPDSVFQVPDDYHVTTLAVLFQSIMPTRPAVPAPGAPSR